MLHKETSAYPTKFSGATDDGDSVLDDPSSYCTCSLAEHGPCKNVPDLKIEEPAQDVTGNGPPTPVITSGTNPAPQSHSVYPPTNSLAPVPQPRTTAQAPPFPQPTHSSAPHVQPQVHFGRPIQPFVGVTSTVPQTGPTFPQPQVLVPPIL
jgi:hypothetical protein